MNNIKLLQIIILVCSGIIAMYILIDLNIKKRYFKKNKNVKINNNKYIVLIFIIIMLFLLYGILRNFE